MFQVLLNRVNGSVHLHRSIGYGKVRRKGLRDCHIQDSNEELTNQLPAQGGDETGSVFHFDEDPLEVLRQRDASQFDDKVSNFESRSLRLDLGLFLGAMKVGDLHHEQVEEAVGDQWDLLGARVQDGEDRDGILLIVQHVDGFRGTCLDDGCVGIAVH